MSYILNGHYHKDNPPMDASVPRPTSVWKHSDHDRQRADHKRDMLRPHNPDGTWSDEFLQQYPGEAEASWGWKPPEQEDLRSTL